MTTTVLLFSLSLLTASLGLAAAFYEGASDVQNLTPSNFDSTLTGGNRSVYAVEFYAPWCGHCKNLIPEWKKAAKALKGIVGVAAVDADAHKELGGCFNVQGYPTIKLFHVSGGKLVSSDYSGGRSAADIVKGALAEAAKVALGRIGAKASGSSGGGRASGGGAQAGCGAGGGGGGGGGGQDLYGAQTDIVKLTDADFHEQVTNSEDLWMIEFYAPWCGHCKNLAPHYDKFATAVRGKVKVGAVDCTQQQQICQEFGVQGYPTVKWFGENKNSPVDFDGGRDESSLTAYALEKWQMALPPPEVKQLTDQEGFVENCVGAPADEGLELAAVPGRQLCFLLFAPNILDSQAAGRNKYLDVLKQLAETHKSRPFSYLWVEAGAQPGLEAAVGVGGYGYPALVALSPSKLKFAALRSAYELDAVKTFVNHVRQGSERVQPVHGDALPTLHTTEPWDGKDGKPPEEDEFDLADLMNEEL